MQESIILKGIKIKNGKINPQTLYLEKDEKRVYSYDLPEFEIKISRKLKFNDTQIKKVITSSE